MKTHTTTTCRPSRPRPQRRRGAVLSVEMMFILPLLVVVLLAITQFSFTLLGMMALNAAANVGAREAALPSATLTTVEDAVDAALSGWLFQGQHEVAAFVNGVKDDGVNGAVEDAVTGDELQVTVILGATHATGDMLKFIGLSVANQELRATYVTRRE